MKVNLKSFIQKNWPWLAGFAISQVTLAALSKAQDKKREEEAMDEVRRITHESIQQMTAHMIDTSGLDMLREKIIEQRRAIDEIKENMDEEDEKES